MFKTLFIIPAALTLSSFLYSAHAANVGDVAGDVYSTDIVAYVDDMPIRSYNIGGKTAIPIEDLRSYGFDVEWDPETLRLYININKKPSEIPSFVPQRQTAGNIVGHTYYTNIRSYFEEIEMIDFQTKEPKTFNIGGTTCAVIEDIAVMQGSSGIETPIYSSYGMTYTWNGADRTIKLYTLRPGDIVTLPFGTAEIMDITTMYAADMYSTESAGQGEMYNIYTAGKFYTDVSALPDVYGFNAEVNNGVYTITSSKNDDINCFSASSRNYMPYNGEIMLKLAMRISIDGKDELPNYPNAAYICGRIGVNDALYVSTDFIEEYSGRVFNLQ